MTTNRRARSTQMQFRLPSAAERCVRLDEALERELICALAALLHAAARSDVERKTTRGEDEDE